MSRLYFRDESPEGSPSLAKVAFAVTAGAIVGTRARMGGTLVLAGLASWLLSRKLARRRPCAKHHDLSPESLPAPAQAQPLEAALPAKDIFEPTNPFLASGPAPDLGPTAPTPPPSLEELRSSLQPPAALFTPSVPNSPSGPLDSAPLFVEVPDSSPPPASLVEPAILPDAITIPTTPDPPPALYSHPLESPQAVVPAAGNSLLNPGFVPTPRQSVIVPKAGMPAPAVPPAAEQTPKGGNAEPPATPPPPARKNFIEWLRDGRGID